MSVDRLQKIIARAGLASRREAEEMILAGRVRVNGRVVTELGTKADAERDHIKVDNKMISRPEETRYILLYKPKEVMTTSDDPEGRMTVIHLLKGVRERVFPVGRLDYHSEGLLVLTNDGELAFRLSHPTHGALKVYQVKVKGVPAERLIEKLERGITLDGKRTRPAEITRLRTTGSRQDEGNSWFEVTLQEGRTQQIRRMFAAIGHPVAKLKRTSIGALSDPKLLPGQWRDLTPKEVRLLTAAEKRPARPRRTTSGAKAKAPARRRAKAGEKAAGSRTAGARKKGASRKKAPARPNTARRR